MGPPCDVSMFGVYFDKLVRTDEGRFKPPEVTLRRDIPPGSTLIFDVELVAIVTGE